MIGRMLCSFGLHRVVTTREGKQTTPGSSRSATPRTTGAATHIHCFCYRPGCQFHVIIDTHSGEKLLHVDGNGTRVAG
jgi:hypothetical protein